MYNRRNTTEMYCTDPLCESFNQPREFRYAPASWDAPSEWIDEPECPDCLSSCAEQRLDTEDRVIDLVDELAEYLPVQFVHMNPSARAFDKAYQLVHQFVKEGQS